MFTHQAVRVVIARLTHGHVGWLLGRADKGDVQVMGIYEPDADVVERYAKQFGFDRRLAHTDFESMLDAVNPEAVVSFGSIAEHLSVVEAAAPRGIHVMVEKPLAFTIEHAEKMEALAKRHSIHVLTNYETTWYPSGYTAFQLVHDEEAVGPIRKVVVRDGHFGPKEVAVAPEFLSWLIDPAQSGGGALIDFGCYGANLMTWLMRGAAPLTVTAVTQQLKRDSVYERVDDEATIILTTRAHRRSFRHPGTGPIIARTWRSSARTAASSLPTASTCVYACGVSRRSGRSRRGNCRPITPTASPTLLPWCAARSRWPIRTARRWPIISLWYAFSMRRDAPHGPGRQSA